MQLDYNTQMYTHAKLLSCPGHCQATTGLSRMALREFLDTAKLNKVIANPLVSQPLDNKNNQLN